MISRYNLSPERFFRYVTHEQINDYAKLGWRHVYGLEGTHHGHYAVLMRWDGEGEPVKPQERVQ